MSKIFLCDINWEIKLVQKMFECQPWHKYNWHKCNLNLRVTDRPTLGICLIQPAQRISPEEKRRKGGSTTRHINRSEKERPENSSQSMFSLSFLSVIHEARYKAIIDLNKQTSKLCLNILLSYRFLHIFIFFIYLSNVVRRPKRLIEK